MASNAEFRRVVNYADLERLLECLFRLFISLIRILGDVFISSGPLCLDRFDQPRKSNEKSNVKILMKILFFSQA